MVRSSFSVVALRVLFVTIFYPALAGSFVNWESPHVAPIDITPNGRRILAVNTADNRLEIMRVGIRELTCLASVAVGLDPVSVRARSNTEAWVVNHVSDSVSVVDLSTFRVRATVQTDDEPADVVFSVRDARAGDVVERAFVSCSQANTILVFDPQDPTVLYYGANSVYRSINRAASWTAISPDLTDGPGNGSLVFGTVTTIAVAPSDANTIWAGSDDGHVWVTQNLGTSWTDVSAGLPQRWVTRVTAHPTQPLEAFVTVSGYRWDEPEANVYYTNDGGQTWVPRSSGLPEAPVNDLLFDPLDADRLYIGSDVGVFYSDDAGLTWDVVGAGLPAAPVLDIDLHHSTRTLVASTYGRSMYRFDLSALPTAGDQIVEPQSSSLSIFPNPVRTAATIRYTLERPSSVILEVFDSRGRRVEVLEQGTVSQVRTRYSGEQTRDWLRVSM